MGLTREDVEARLAHIQQDHQTLLEQHRQLLQGIKVLEQKILQSQGAIAEVGNFLTQTQKRDVGEGAGLPPAPEPDNKMVDMPPRE